MAVLNPSNCAQCAADLPANAKFCTECGAKIESIPDPYVGELVVGRYRCTEPIAVGETCYVYKANHTHLARVRVLKILKDEYAMRPDAIEAFWREARIASGFRHPNLVTLYEADELPDGTPCTIWELVEGTTLTTRVKRAPMGRSVTKLARDLCAALDAVHHEGMVHGGVSPDNVMLTAGAKSLEARLLDFGETRLQGASAQRALGEPTFGYSAPEQVFQNGKVSASTDVFSLGVVIFYAYTGRLPWAAVDWDHHVDELQQFDASSLASLQDLPVVLRTVVSSCLQRDQHARPRDAAALRDAIKRASREAGKLDESNPSLTRVPTAPMLASAAQPAGYGASLGHRGTPGVGPAPAPAPPADTGAEPPTEVTPIPGHASMVSEPQTVAPDAAASEPPTVALNNPMPTEPPTVALNAATPEPPTVALNNPVPTEPPTIALPTDPASALGSPAHLNGPEAPGAIAGAPVSPASAVKPAPRVIKQTPGHETRVINAPTTMTRTLPDHERLRLPVAQLQAVQNCSVGPLRLQVLTTFGRSTANTLPLDHPTVSKRHARIRCQDGVFTLEDLGSSNGTAVNGKRVSHPMTLQHGDRLSFGEVVMRFELLHEPP